MILHLEVRIAFTYTWRQAGLLEAPTSLSEFSGMLVNITGIYRNHSSQWTGTDNDICIDKTTSSDKTYISQFKGGSQTVYFLSLPNSDGQNENR